MVSQTPAVGAAVARARAVLQEVRDPEVPVLSIVELGIVRGVEVDPDRGSVTVTVTPTYSGCPAMKAIEDDIVAALTEAGFESVKVETVYAPAWTTDWIEAPAREKLRAYGIAPPGRVTQADSELVQISPAESVRRSAGPPDRLLCPWCGSADTALVSEFGATACKSLHVCNTCRQPFERFKTF